MKRLVQVLMLLVLIAVLAISPVTNANDAFPRKTVEFVVPWAAGGGVDTLMRAIAAVFPKYANNEQMIIKNVPGGGGAIGFNEAAKARPDGYTLTSGTTPLITKIHMTPVPFGLESFEPVMLFADIPCYIMVPTDSPYQNLQDYVADAKKRPGKITLGNSGAGGGNHLVALAFEQYAGIKLNHIPFEGGGKSFTALMGKHVDSVIGSSPEGIPQALAGELRILGIFGDQQLAQFPQVLTAAQQGFDFTGTMWRGIVAPKGTPKAIIDRLDQIFKNCMNDPEFMKRAEEMTAPLKYMGPAEFGEFMKTEDVRWKELIINSKLGDRYKNLY